MDPEIEVQFTINGRAVTDRVPGTMTLVEYLRERRKLTGTKKGCGQGHCGSCTVLLNGKAVRSCLIRLSNPKLETRNSKFKMDLIFLSTPDRSPRYL